MAGLVEVTFPAIFIRGQYVGGADNLQRLVENGGFARALSRARVTEAVQPGARLPWSEELEKLKEPDLFHVPNGGTWWLPQLQTYAQFVRGQHAFCESQFLKREFTYSYLTFSPCVPQTASSWYSFSSPWK